MANNPYGRQGWWRWAAVLVPALLVAFLPLPGLNPAQRRLLGVFAGTIISLVLQPVPMGVSMVLAMTVLVLGHILPPTKVLSGFGNPVVWLIVSAFLFARAVTVTGFGRRLAFLLWMCTVLESCARQMKVASPYVRSTEARRTTGGTMS